MAGTGKRERRGMRRGTTGSALLCALMAGLACGAERTSAQQAGTAERPSPAPAAATAPPSTPGRATRAGPRPVLPVEREIALARSAAPPEISAAARVLVWDGSDWVVGAEGTSGVTCWVARSWVEALEPHCHDEEGSRTVLPAHQLQERLRSEGRSEPDVAAAMAEALASGMLRPPIRPAMSWMMSAGQSLVSDDGRPVGAWRPHLMIYYPWLTADGVGLEGVPFTALEAVVVDPGTPWSNLTIAVESFVPVIGATAASGGG